jgi:serine/threonine-protein kinase RsbW
LQRQACGSFPKLLKMKPAGIDEYADRLAENGVTHAVRLVIPAKAEYITLGRLALTGLAQLRPLSEEVLADLKLALTEACTNVVRHAYADGVGLVEIVYELHPDRLVVEVSDSGDGFSRPAPNGAADPEDLVEGGLGIAIIDSLADELEIEDRPDGGSRLRFVKILTV